MGLGNKEKLRLQKAEAEIHGDSKFRVSIREKFGPGPFS